MGRGRGTILVGDRTTPLYSTLLSVTSLSLLLVKTLHWSEPCVGSSFRRLDGFTLRTHHHIHSPYPNGHSPVAVTSAGLRRRQIVISHPKRTLVVVAGAASSRSPAFFAISEGEEKDQILKEEGSGVTVPARRGRCAAAAIGLRSR
ncbi:hypothetical protein PIB30_050156 [Stylosanthes scabra]|uniref:Uncharacterized protein n=1 Tax=Stylosanthes scabra TaxID=79078 RepID=A0ABU6ZGA5_9FABA|nr:hypothetical protein [Stylosanthes scabra]